MVEQGMITIRKKCTDPRLLDDKLHGVLVRIVVAAQRSAAQRSAARVLCKASNSSIALG